MSFKALGIALKLTLTGMNQLIYPETRAFTLVVITCVLTQMNYLNKALDTFNTAVVSPIDYVMFTCLTIVASVIKCKLLARTDIEKRLSVPTKKMRSLPSFRGGHVVELQAIEETEHTWTFTYNRCRNNHPKPVLSRGWLRFVRSKRLVVGDKVNFYKIENPTAGGASFRIQAEKRVQVFGAILGYAPVGNLAP